jgi:capsular exopolysaccharide synthesis family protein
MLNGNFDNNALPAIPRANRLDGSGYIDARSAAKPEPSGGLLEYWKLIKRGKWWVLGFGVLGSIVGFIMVLQEQPLYRAGTTIELQGFNESFMGMNAVDPQAGAGNYQVNAINTNTQIKIIESASVRMPVMERLSRETTPVVPPARTTMDKIRQRLRRAPMDPLREMQNGLGIAGFTLHAKSVTGTRIISITTTSTIPEIAANFVNTLAQEYIAQNSQQRSTTTQKTSQWLESQLEETKVKLEEAETRLETFVKQTGVVFGGGAGETETRNVLSNAKLTQLTGDLAAIQQDRIAKGTKLDAVNEMIKKGALDSIPEIRDSVVLRGLESQLADARRDLADKLVNWMPTNPKLAPLQRKIDDYQAQIKSERENIIQRIRSDYEQAAARESALKKAYNAEAMSATGQQDKVAEYSLLKREVLIYQQTLNSMLQQVNQASVVSAVPANNIRVLDIAYAPGVAFSPDTGSYLGVSALVGMGLGFALVFLKEWFVKQRSTLRFGAPGYAPSVLSVPELGVIPSGNFELGNGAPPKRKWRRIKAPAIELFEADGGASGLALSGWQGKPSLLVESFRLTMTSLMLMFRNSPQVLVVTSPGPGEGKTTISANLAMAMAEAGRKVLVIDMDLRRPQLHTLFNLPNDRGFTDLVRNDDLPLRITEADPAILRTPYPRVSVLPSGHIKVSDIGEVFHSPRVAGLLRQLRECFDTIIIDTPPMLQFSESRLASSLADGVLLVLRSGHTDKESAMAAREQLAHDRIELLGTILNDWNPKQSGPSSSYGSYYNAYMKYHSNEKA